MTELDAIDRKILSLLQQDSRLTMQEISEKVGLSPSPCHRRIKMLEERGIITRYGVTIDQRAVGLPVSVFVSIKLARQQEEDLERFAKAVAAWSEVMECYLMTGEADYQLRILVRSLTEFEDFLRYRLTRVTGVANVTTSFALRPVIYKTSLPTLDQVSS